MPNHGRFFEWTPSKCSYSGCLFFGKHVENCHRCAGFGHWTGGKGIIIAQEALEHKFRKDEFESCSMCGGTPPNVLED